jgi:hypothetical protein
MKLLFYVLAFIAIVLAMIWYFPTFMLIVGIVCAVIGYVLGKNRGVGLGGAVDYWFSKGFNVAGAASSSPQAFV